MTKVFVDERDLYLSYTLHAAAESDPLTPLSPSEQRVLVGVVGIGHVKGIKEHWCKVSAAEARRVTIIPKPSRMEKAVRYTARLSFYALLAVGTYKLFGGPLKKIVTSLTQY